MVKKNLLLILVFFLAAVSFSVFKKKEAPNQSETSFEILTYSSLAQGLGDELKNIGLKNNFKVNIQKVPSAGLLSAVLDHKKKIDLVIGLDQKSALVHKEKYQNVDFDSLVSIENPFFDLGLERKFYVYDWAPLALIIRSSSSIKFKTWNKVFDFLKDKKWILPRPQTSSLGLSFMNYFMESFKTLKVKPVWAASWSDSYSVFQSGAVDYALSYSTSLLYHWEVEKNMDFQIIQVDEGHPVQKEYLAVPKNSDSPHQKVFLKEFYSPQMMKLILEKQFMQPVQSIDHPWEGRIPKLNILKNFSSKFSPKLWDEYCQDVTC